MNGNINFIDTRMKSRSGKTEYYAATGSAVNWGKIPRWLTKRINDAAKREARELKMAVRKRTEIWAKTPEAFVNDAPLPSGPDPIRLLNYSWVDHYGTTKDSPDGIELFVAEPYGLSSTDISEITDVAKRLGIDFSIDAASAWYPTHTVRLIFFLPDAPGSRFKASLNGTQ